MKKKAATPEPETQEAEHMMETFPAPQGMPTEWHEHDITLAKYRLMKQAEQATKAAEDAVEFSTDAEKAAHLMEKFPSLKIEPEDWHCTKCADDEL